MNMNNEKQEIQQQIAVLTADLTSPTSPIGDWKIIKIQEAILAGEPAPYDIVEVRAKRQEVRAEINRLQKLLEQE